MYVLHWLFPVTTQIYTEYISRFDNALKTLEEQKKNPIFAQALQEFESLPKCANIPLAGYMLDVVQRITRYKLLIAGMYYRTDHYIMLWSGTLSS